MTRKRMKNHWGTKIIRTITATFLPVDNRRTGECNRCGKCCQLPERDCPCLVFDSRGLATCRIYKIRPSSCRKYPRNAHENITHAHCSFQFPETDCDTTQSVLK